VILGVREYLRDHGPNGTEPIVGKYVRRRCFGNVPPVERANISVRSALSICLSSLACGEPR
jgi:hypothetical protein